MTLSYFFTSLLLSTHGSPQNVVSASISLLSLTRGRLTDTSLSVSVCGQSPIHLRPISALSCPRQSCDNTVNNNNVWCEAATGATTVTLSESSQGLLTSGDARPGYFIFTFAACNSVFLRIFLSSFLLSSNSCSSFQLSNTFPCCLLFSVGKTEKKNLNGAEAFSPHVP